MVASSSRPDPSAPGAVAGATFATVRKGYDPAQVGRFLGEVAAELERLRQRERELDEELATARAAAADLSSLDDAAVTALLGEETARVLSTAREAASQIRTKASEGAERLLREANEEAARVRGQAELDAARVREQAEQAAEVERERAKEQGRQMVAEARDYREKVIADSGRRREQARQQLAGYAAARDRLAATFAEARAAVDTVLGELGELVVDPDEIVAPVAPSGSAPSAVLGGGASGSPVAVATPAGSPTVVSPAEPSPAPEVGRGPAEAIDDGPGSDLDGRDDLECEPDSGVDAGAGDPDGDRLAPVVSLFAPDVANGPVDEEEPITEELPAVGKASVDDLFARLRAARAADVAEVVQPPAPRVADDPAVSAAGVPHAAPLPAQGASPGASEAGSIDAEEPDESPFVVRDEALAPIESKLARKLKRILADEQNDILDILRRKDPIRSLGALLPGGDEHLRAYLTVVDEELPAAALAGARASSGEDPARLARRVHDADVVERTVAHLDEELIEPLRLRLDHAVHVAGGDNAAISDEVRTIYREWKTVVLDDLAGALARRAYARAGYAVLVPGTPVRWLADPGAAPCPESQLNAAASAVPAGDPFPSGDVSPPAHAGCRCLLVAIPDAEGATVASTG